MKKTLLGFVVGAVVFAGITFTGQEAINRVQERFDRLGGMIQRLTNEMGNMVDHHNNKVQELESQIQDKYDRLESEAENNNSLLAEIARLENELRIANQAVETLDNNTRDRYENAVRNYENRRGLEDMTQ